MSEANRTLKSTSRGSVVLAGRFGECDMCHVDGSLHVVLEPNGQESEPDAEWLYCRSCALSLIAVRS